MAKRLNPELVWLAETVGIKDVRPFSTDQQLAGAIFIKIELLKERGNGAG